MTKGEFRGLIEQTESPRLECKQSLPSVNEVAEYALGIGNSGGYLVVGVTDKLPRRVISLGPAPTDRELERLQSGVADGAQIHICIEWVDTGKGRVLRRGGAGME